MVSKMRILIDLTTKVIHKMKMQTQAERQGNVGGSPESKASAKFMEVGSTASGRTNSKNSSTIRGQTQGAAAQSEEGLHLQQLDQEL